MRGKGQLLNHFLTDCRITPAYAGKSRSLPLPRRVPWDHPRLCGEKIDGIIQAISGVGSPPPMRGKVKPKAEYFDELGITPAYAGKRARVAYCVVPKGDHPRLCGEKLQDTADFTHVAGSPPPMRGKGIMCRVLHIIYRITPAYAGKRG